MDISELHRILSRYTEIGFMEAVRAYEPASDQIRESELRKWLKMMHIEQKQFKNLLNKRLVKPFRKGTSANSPLYYSKKDIIQALGTAEVLIAQRDDMVRRVLKKETEQQII